MDKTIQPILFQDYLQIQNFSIPGENKTQFIDNVLKSMDSNQDGSVSGLEVRLRASHAAKLTQHYHYYSPAKVNKAAKTFLKPFPKPVLTHHETLKDPIGRAAASTYISTPSPIIPASILSQADRDQLHTKKSLSYIEKLKPFLFDRTFEGLGYLNLLINVTDPNAIPKVIDGRFNTVSIGYGTDTLHCSVCYHDIWNDGPCEHYNPKLGKTAGRLYKGQPMFLIFGDLTYGEVSYVNEPADELAMTESVKKTTIPVLMQLGDKINKTDRFEDKLELTHQYMLADSLLVKDPSRMAVTKQGIYYYDSKEDKHISLYSKLDTIGASMNLQELKALGKNDLYNKIKESLADGIALSDEDFAKIEDDKFVSDIFPAFDKDHILASRLIVDTFEDSGEKTELLSFLDNRLALIEEAPAKVETTDGISYSFSIRAEGGEWSSPDNSEPEKEKAILAMLMSFYKKDAKDYFLSQYKDLVEEEKTGLIDSLKTTFGIRDDNKIAELEDSLKTQRTEYKHLQDLKNQEAGRADALTAELKAVYMEKLSSFKSKEDPTEGKDGLKELFKDKSLNELKTAIEALEFVSVTDSPAVEHVDDPTLKIQKEISDADFKKMDKAITEAYEKIKSEQGVGAADQFRAMQQKRIESFRNKKQTTETK